jgi:MFS family permease
MAATKNRTTPSKTLVYSTAGAVAFIVLTGVVSLFADMNYEGGRSVAGQYLTLLGTSALALGLAAGFGEFVGYALRLLSGTLADKTRRYWLLIVLGYIIQLGSLPAMAFASGWELAIIFLFCERLGKAIRKPAHDALISFAAKRTGSGFGFGLHEAMDQIGAFAGPALFSLLLFTGPQGSSLSAYRDGLLLLFIPAGLAVVLTLVARFVFPQPQRFEIASKTPQIAFGGFPAIFWLLTLASGLLALGVTDFPLVGLHLSKTGAFPSAAIPLLYAGAMAVDAGAALLVGLLYDRLGLKVLVVLFLAELLTAPLLFLGGMPAIIVGMALWGISVGTQESILKAAIGDRVPEERRARAFGLFHTVFGALWFLGSAAMGGLYDSFGAWPLVVFSVLAQAAACLLFFVALGRDRRDNAGVVQDRPGAMGGTE